MDHNDRETCVFCTKQYQRLRSHLPRCQKRPDSSILYEAAVRNHDRNMKEKKRSRDSQWVSDRRIKAKALEGYGEQEYLDHGFSDFVYEFDPCGQNDDVIMDESNEENQDPVENEVQKLGKNEQKLLMSLCEIVPKLSKKVAKKHTDAVLKFWKGDVPFKDFKTFSHFVQNVSQRVMLESTKLLTIKSADQVYMYHVHHFGVDGAKAMLQEMINKVGMQNIIFQPHVLSDSLGNRQYGEVANGDWMSETYEKVKALNADADLLPIAFYSDKTLTKSFRSLLPVIMFLPTSNVDIRYTSMAYRMIGHIPVIPSIGQNARNKRLNNWMYTRSLSLILEPFKKLSHQGVVLTGPNGVNKTVYPVPVFYVADLLEYQTIFGISASKIVPDGYQDPQYKIQTKDLSANLEYGIMPKARNEQATSRRIRAAQELADSEREEDVQKAKEMLEKYSISKNFLYSPGSEKTTIYQHVGNNDTIPIAGFKWTNCHDLVVPDLLHTLHSGVGRAIYDHNMDSKNCLFNIALKGNIGRPKLLLKRMNDCIAKSSPLTDYSLPTTKFAESEHAKKKVSCEQIANLCRLFLVALLVEKEVLGPVIPPLKAYLDFEAMVMRKVHTEESLQSMHGMIKVMKDALSDAWKSIHAEARNKATGANEGPNFNTLKFFALHKFVAEVSRSACASVTNTGPWERTHKDAKRANHFTNGRQGDDVNQTLRRLHLHEMSKDVQRLAKTTEYNTASRRCIATRTLAVEGSHICQCLFGNLNEEIGPYAKYWSEMDWLSDGIQWLFKCTYKLGKHFEVPENTLVTIYAKACMPYVKTPGSPLTSKLLLGTTFYYKEIHGIQLKRDKDEISENEYNSLIQEVQNRLGSFVTARGDEDKVSKEKQTWHAEVICFVKLTLPSEGTTLPRKMAGSTFELAFLKWYKEKEIHPLLNLPVFTVEKTQRMHKGSGRQKSVPFTDCVLTNDLLRPAFMQKDPSTALNRYVHNEYIT